jgi:hypothetical protein
VSRDLVTDEYINIWLEQVRRERKHNPADRAQVDFDTWESMLFELRARRAADLTDERTALRSVRDREAKARDRLPKRAFVWWNSNICYVIDEATRAHVASSVHFRRATRAAQRRGYDVIVYKGEHAALPRDATHVSDGSYVLPAVERL